MLENVVTIAIVIAIANANVKFFSISGCFFISFLHLHHIVCHRLIRAKMDHWNNHREITAWLPVFRAGTLRSPSCRLKRSYTLWHLSLLLSHFHFALFFPSPHSSVASPESKCFFSLQMLEDMKKGNWEHALLLLRYWTSHCYPVIRIHSAQ